MAIYEFSVEEVIRGGYITYDAIDAHTEIRVSLEGTMKVGEYPEIEAYLSNGPYNFEGKLIYTPRRGDSFDQPQQTWEFKCGPDSVIVRDIPRTVIRVTLDSGN